MDAQLRKPRPLARKCSECIPWSWTGQYLQRRCHRGQQLQIPDQPSIQLLQTVSPPIKTGLQRLGERDNDLPLPATNGLEGPSGIRCQNRKVSPDLGLHCFQWLKLFSNALSSMATNIFLNLISVLQQTGFDLTSFDVLFFKVYFGDRIPASETVKFVWKRKFSKNSLWNKINLP